MNAQLVDAVTLRDGDTTTVTLELDNAQTHQFTVDYSLPWDGRTRFVYEVPPGKTREKLNVGGTREREAIQAVYRCLAEQFGEARAREYIEGKAKCAGGGKWFYAVNFLSILKREGRAI